RRKRKQRLFQKDIENLLFAMGDRPVSTDMSVLALEEILVEYLSDLCHSTMAYSRSQGRSRIKMNDLAFALRNDPLKLARFQYTIEQSYRIEKAKKMFEENTDAVGASVGNQDSDEEEDDEE
ncbi:TFIID subunit, partial [Scheffersomyces stipitis CBS 6054]